MLRNKGIEVTITEFVVMSIIYASLDLIGATTLCAGDIQVIPAAGSVISIYSIGGTPEVPAHTEPFDADSNPNALTDVVVTPTAALISLQEPTNTVSVGSSSEQSHSSFSATTTTATRATNDSGLRIRSSPRNVTTTDGSLAPPFVTLAWDASPDDSVVGYRVYSGVSSHQYSDSQLVEGQTFARVLIAPPTMYFVVTAYNAQGLESQPSDELTVTIPPPSDSGPINDPQPGVEPNGLQNPAGASASTSAGGQISASPN